MEKTVKAAEVKKLPVGSKVRLHLRTADGLHDWQDGTVVLIHGKYKVLRFEDFFDGVYTKPITDLPGQYYTVEEQHD